MTVKFAPPFLVMTSSYEAVMSVTGIFFQNASIRYELKLTKFQRLSESRLGVILKKFEGGSYRPPQGGIGLSTKEYIVFAQ